MEQSLQPLPHPAQRRQRNNLGSSCSVQSREIQRMLRVQDNSPEPFFVLTAPCCPLSPDFFADAAWCHIAAFLQKIGGEGRGEGDVVHAGNIDERATSVIPTLQTWHCPAMRDADGVLIEDDYCCCNTTTAAVVLYPAHGFLQRRPIISSMGRSIRFQHRPAESSTMSVEGRSTSVDR